MTSKTDYDKLIEISKCKLYNHNLSKLQSLKAHEIAKRVHYGQTDKSGIDDIKQPETVASFVIADEKNPCAYLHDIIEDTSPPLLDLEQKGFSKKMIEAVDILTKKNKDINLISI